MRAIAIGMLGILLVSTAAAAQTAAERDRILRDFQRPSRSTTPAITASTCSQRH